MIVSHRHRFALLAPWKSASSTNNARLGPYNESPYSQFYDYNPYLQRVVHQHITYADFAMLPESRRGYFCAAFVRNPYDRVYSGFLQLQRDIQQQPSAPFPSLWVKALVTRQLADNLAQLEAGEFDFNKWFALVEEFQIYEVGRNSSFPLHPAHYWTGVNGKQNVDFVGRVEHFERDFDFFCQKVGIRPRNRANINVSDNAPIPATSAQPKYLHLINDNSISKINSVFKLDFSLFDYKMY